MGGRSRMGLAGFFFSSRRRHTRFKCDWSSDVCSSDLPLAAAPRLFNEVGRGLIFGFVVRLFVAFRAGAFPASERLVAGLSRLDFLGAPRLRADDVVD